MTEISDRLKEWDEFSKEMREYIGTFTGPKYGDPTINVPVPTFIAIWNIVKYSIRCWKGYSKRHDIFKIAHYACFAWVGNNKLPQVPNDNPLIKKNGIIKELSGDQVLMGYSTRNELS